MPISDLYTVEQFNYYIVVVVEIQGIFERKEKRRLEMMGALVSW